MVTKKKKKNVNEFKHGLFLYTRVCEISFETILETIANTGGCNELRSEFKKVVENYGIDFGNLTFPSMMKILLKEEEWLKWLIDQDFIDKDEDFLVSIGDIFTFRGDPHMVVNSNDNLCLVNLSNGVAGDSFDVNDIFSLTIENLFDIFEVDPGDPDSLIDIISKRIPVGQTQIKRKGKK